MKKLASLLIFLSLSYIVHAQTFLSKYNATEQLNINNVNAGFVVQNNMFIDPLGGCGATANYEFPKGSGKHSNFNTALWMGGFEQTTNQLHVAAQTYRQRGCDYWPGPLDASSGTSDSIVAYDWNQIWKINLSTIDSFLSINTHTLSNTHSSILEWPAKGNIFSRTTSKTSLIIPNRDMAPFVDVDNDGIYNPLLGDYPKISGEQMLWWVFNDNAATHTETGSLPLQIEVQTSAYACRQAGLENTIFVKYQIYNWGAHTFDSTVVGLWSEIDVGYGFDDFIGFDSTYRMAVAYNGDTLDELINGYGNMLTQHGTVLVSSPFDAINYKEPIGAFTFFSNGNSRMGSPQTLDDYYGYMTGTWKDNSPFRQGCSPGFAQVGTPSKFVFPDDPSIPNGISEFTCSNRVPFDRRFVLSSSPFLLQPSTQPLEFIYAFINTDTGVDNSNFNELRRLADSAYTYVNACSGPSFATGLNTFEDNNIQLYPNPAHDYVMIRDKEAGAKTIRLYSAAGQIVFEENYNAADKKLSTLNYTPGLYFIELIKAKKHLVEKLRIE